jgi:serine/threonine protein phosphatase PrpC
MEEITEDEMATHPDQNKLLKSIGTKKDVKITFATTDLKEDFVILVCSDGFWEYVSSDEMREYLYSMSLEKAHKTMIDLALQRGGDSGDNISVATCTHSKEFSTMKKFVNFLNKDIKDLF